MRRHRTSLRLLFERERDQIARLVRRLTRRTRPETGRRHSRRPANEESVPTGPPPPPHPRARKLRAILHAVGPTASLALHAVLLWILIKWPREQPPPGPGRGESLPITIRLLPRKSPAPRAEPPRPTPAPPPLELATETRTEVPRTEPAPAATPGAEVAEPRPGEPEIPPTTAPEPEAAPTRGTATMSPLPLPIGLGARGAPPLPGAGPGGGSPFGSRGRGKAAALSLHGGNGSTEGAVQRGLRWLAEHQEPDGSWSAEGFSRQCRHTIPCRGPGQGQFDTGITALAALAFLGAGYVPGLRDVGLEAADPALLLYARNVEKALDALLARQNGAGAFGAEGENYFYNHAIGTLAVAEAYALTGKARFRESALAAISFSVRAQQSTGGWDYTSSATGRSDLSITGWQILAFRAALAGGLEVPEGTLASARAFLDRAVTPEGEGIYATLGEEARRKGINMVAVGCLARIFLGALPSDDRIRRGAERLLRAPPEARATEAWEQTFQSYYSWYTATLALFHLGGDPWKAWNVLLQRAVLPLQASRGHEEGSWPPESSWIGMSGGRVYATAILVLTLETYYRHEPIFKQRRS